MEVEFIKKVLNSTAWYWVVAKKNYKGRFNDFRRDDDDIMFVVIPEKAREGVDIKNILLSDVERFNDMYLDHNIFLSNNYPPFQQYQSVKSIHDGFPIVDVIGVNDFLIKAMQMESTSLYDYEKLMKSIVTPKHQ